jgi:hypothetical protein
MKGILSENGHEYYTHVTEARNALVILLLETNSVALPSFTF